MPHDSPTTSLSSPVIPAAGSACPMLAFTPPTASGARLVPRDASSAPESEPASIGSPRAVPVPCASLSVKASAAAAASASAAVIRPCCACPLGAVRLAERPSWRTALPSMSGGASAALCCSASAPQASPRAYPLARMSKVWQRPLAEVMPAMPKLVPVPGVSMSVTPATSATLHSLICIARRPACPAVSAAEHAVSYDAHGPCSPSTYEMRPAAIERAEPVAEYTLLPAGVKGST